MEWSQNFIQLLRSFNAERVRYLVVGGYAVSYHGHPRYTGDLDLWVEPSEKNAEAIRDACAQADVILPPVAFESVKTPDQIIRLGIRPVQVDLITSMPELDFESAWQAKRFLHHDGVEIPIIDLVSLRKTKAATGRFQDLADLENLPEA